MREWEDPGHIVITEFSTRELDSARWLHMSAWENGYALPQEDFKFFEVTFDRTHACSFCGYGKIQTGPFRIKMEPKWGRKGIMSLNGAYDELFVPPAVWETIFKPFGITCRPVANRHGKILETVVQIVIEEKIDLLTDALKVRELCNTCGRRKYQYPKRGRFPTLAQEPSGAIAKTRQTFHDGWDIVDIIISQELRRAMISHKLRGAEFEPVESHLDAYEA
jgi:ribosomal protein L37E